MTLRSLPAKVVRRLLWLAEDVETGWPSRFRKRFPDCYETVKALARLNPRKIRRVYDVGARKGDWIRTFHAFFPSLQQAVLFEPATACRESLAGLRLKGVDLQLSETALGKTSGRAVLIGAGPSASLKKTTPFQEQFFPGSTCDQSSEVEIDSLDRWQTESGLPPPDLLKIDVQGAELDVLSGAEGTLSFCRWLVLEVSTLPLYQGQPLSGETIAWLETRGWHFVGSGYRWLSPEGQLLQFDALFTREDVL